MEGDDKVEDREIVALYLARSEKAITATDERYGKYCRSIALRILHDERDVEECVSDVYRHIWSVIPPQSPSSLRAFLGAVTRHLALDCYDRRMTQKRGAGEVPLLLEELADCVPTAENGDTQTETIVIRDTLDRFLEQLPPAERWLFLRRYWYADTVQELARATDMRENAVSVTLYRIRKKLKTALEKEGISI